MDLSYTCAKKKEGYRHIQLHFFQCDKRLRFLLNFHRVDSRRLRCPHKSACVRAFDSAEAQTETKDYTTWLTRHGEANSRRELCVCVFTCTRAGGRGDENGGTDREGEREREKEREKKKRDRTATERRDIHHALTNSASIARACARVYGRTWMCAEKRILPSTVERTRASSCPRTPPRKPLWNQPHPSWWNPRLPSSCHRLFPLTSRFSIPLRTIPPDCDNIEELCALHESESNTSLHWREIKEYHYK